MAPRVTVSVHCPHPLYDALTEYVASDDSPDDASLSNTFARAAVAYLPEDRRPEVDPSYTPDAPVQDAILEALSDGAMHREDIADAVGADLSVAANTLTTLRAKGSVEPRGGGVWGLTAPEQSAD